MPRTLLFYIAMIFACTSNVAASELKPLRITTPLTIDGKLDEPAWQQAHFVSGFKTFTPDYGREMPEKTEVTIAYDDENLYFAFRCFDEQPQRIKSTITRRDNLRADDWVCINLDSFNDQQALYAFYINPSGIQGDTRYANGREDPGIDLFWYSAGDIHENGYTIEVKIPFKSIRFKNAPSVNMGVIFERRISRTSEQGTFPPLDPQQAGAFLTQMMPFQLQGVKDYKLFELLPALTYGRNSERLDGKLALSDELGDFSLTTKMGLTSNLILDGTYNPDFSQVESDAGQVDLNLRHSIFFPERRPFFMEGAENFNFSGSSGGDPLQKVVHTRTISDPIGGVKLSGKLGPKDFIAVIDAFDELPDDANNAHVSILRYKRALAKDGHFGLFYTGRDAGPGHNRVFGPDGNIRLTKSSTMGYHFFASRNKVDAEDKGNGHALGVTYSHVTRNLSFNAGFHDLSEDFTTQTGFLTRTNVTRGRFLIRPAFYPKSKMFRRLTTTYSTIVVKDKESDLFETSNAFTLGLTLMGNSRLSIRGAKASEIFLGKKFNVSNFDFSASSQLTKQVYLYYNYNYGKRIRYIENPFNGNDHRISALARWQPSINLTTQLNWTFEDFSDSERTEDNFAVHILRGRMTWQLNRYLFIRGIVEHNDLTNTVKPEFLASFTYIPGTAVHFGFGSLYEKFNRTRADGSIQGRIFRESKRGIFMKASYFWRL